MKVKFVNSGFDTIDWELEIKYSKGETQVYLYPKEVYDKFEYNGTQIMPAKDAKIVSGKKYKKDFHVIYMKGKQTVADVLLYFRKEKMDVSLV